MRDLTSRALDTATALGATYADVRVVRRLEESITIKSSRVEGVSSRATVCGRPSSSTRIWSALSRSTYSPFRSTWKRT